jgi:uncharacterized protein YbaA (DUF1428 family)
MNYVDGFVVPVQKKKVSAYRSMAKLSAKVWLDHGALAFMKALPTMCHTASGLRSRAA